MTLERMFFWDARGLEEGQNGDKNVEVRMFRCLTVGNEKIKLNFDGAVVGGMATYGFVLRGFSGAIICVGFSEVSLRNVLDTELQGLDL